MIERKEAFRRLMQKQREQWRANHRNEASKRRYASKYRGVYRLNTKWTARHPVSRAYLGYFDTELDAAEALAAETGAAVEDLLRDAPEDSGGSFWRCKPAARMR